MRAGHIILIGGPKDSTQPYFRYALHTAVKKSVSIGLLTKTKKALSKSYI